MGLIWCEKKGTNKVRKYKGKLLRGPTTTVGESKRKSGDNDVDFNVKYGVDMT